jgi:hypothetical protein
MPDPVAPAAGAAPVAPAAPASGAAGGGVPGQPAADAKPAADDLVALRAKVAELEAAASKAAADKAVADKAAADKAEADRVAALTADQKRDEELKAQRADLDKTRAELVAGRRSLVLERMGVLAHFREYAPQVDPQDVDGAKALEKWALEHPEAVARNSSAQITPIKPMGALAELLAGKRTSPLLKPEWAAKLLGDASN